MNFSMNMLHDALSAYCADMDNEDAKKYCDHARKSRNAKNIASMLTLSRPSFYITADKLDSDGFKLNTPAGLVDLTTGNIIPHESSQLCTHITNCSPSNDGAELWCEFLDRLTGEDSELIQYLQDVIGMCCIGKITYEGIILAIGGGRNGKSTFFNAISSVLGDYATGIDSTILTTEKQNRGASLATLRGNRFVVCGELEEGQRLSVQTLKRLASTDPLTIEEKYKSPETVTPTHHICLFSNFLPRVGSTDNGTWRRLSVISFNQKMPSGKDDIVNYADKLAKEAGGAILTWAIKGAQHFIANGCHLNPPQSVSAATIDFKRRENWFDNFISESCTVDHSASIRCGVLYSYYKDYAAQTGDYCRRLTDFNAAMEMAGFKQVTRGGNKKYWCGITYGEASQAGINTNYSVS